MRPYRAPVDQSNWEAAMKILLASFPDCGSISDVRITRTSFMGQDSSNWMVSARFPSLHDLPSQRTLDDIAKSQSRLSRQVRIR